MFVLSQKSSSPTNQNTQKEVSDSESASRDCSGEPLAELTEGPYYKEGSPERQKISEDGTPGTHLILKGYVFDTECKRISNAWLDFWQADGEGNYDNEGFNLRGHQFTNKDGFFRIETVVPGQYPGRTEHIHFKVRRDEKSSAITSQLFFPDASGNHSDSIYSDSLLVDFGTDPDGSKYASFNIVVP